jgi:hypothetical protein
VGSVFANAALYPDTANKTLAQALDGKAGSNNEVKNLLRQAVAAVLNAASPNIDYAFSLDDVITAVNAALSSGKQAMKSLTELLDDANNEKNCDKPAGDANCDTDGKPNVLTLSYVGISCAQASNSQMSISGKYSCTGDPMMAPTVRIIASDSSSTPTATSQRYFDGMVPLNGTFEVKSADGGKATFGANTYFFIYVNGVWAQTVQMHTSCSAPLRDGETFGSLLLVDYRIDP